MAGILIRMKVAILRHSMTGARASLMITGGVIGLVLAGGTIWLSLLSFANPTVTADLLASAYIAWMLGWIIGPMWGGSTELRADHLALLPLPRRRLAVGLLAAAFVGITTAVTLLALTSLIVYGARLGAVPALIAVPASLLELAFVVLLSQVARVVFGVAAASRIGAAITGVILAGMSVLAQSGWMLFVGLEYSGVLVTGFGSGFGTAVRAIPSGWALVAVEAAHTGTWWQAVGALAGLAVLIAALLLGWSRSLSTPRRRHAVVRGSRGRSSQQLFGTSTGAVLQKELRTWWRDPLRIQGIFMALAWALGTTLLPLSFGVKVVLPWAAPALAVMAASCVCNLYGQDGTALWMTMMTGSERADVRARQWAYAVITLPLLVVVAVVFTVWSGLSWAWPWVLALTPALFGGGIGLATLVSVVSIAPGPDAHKRPDNPLEHGNTTGPANLVFWCTLLAGGPPAILLGVGTAAKSGALVWSSVPLGVAEGVLLAWWLGRLAVRHLRTHAPEMLFLMRTGRPTKVPAKPSTSRSGGAEAPKRAAWTTLIYSIAGPIALFPQGIVPMILLLVSPHVRVWFLAMYMPSALRWPTAAVMIVLGTWLCYLLIRTTRPGRNKSDVDIAADAVKLGD